MDIDGLMMVLLDFCLNGGQGRRTAMAKRRLKQQGKFTGGLVPYGFALIDGSLVDNASEQKVIKACRIMRADGMSLRSIGRELEFLGLRTRNGNPWNPHQIKRIIDNEEKTTP